MVDRQELLEWISVLTRRGHPMSVYAISAAQPWPLEHVEAEVETLAREGLVERHPGIVENAVYGTLDGFTISPAYQGSKGDSGGE